MTPTADPEQEWCVIITAEGTPLTYGGGAAVLFASPEDARGWMQPGDLRVDPWDGVGLGQPRMPSYVSVG